VRHEVFQPPGSPANSANWPLVNQKNKCPFRRTAYLVDDTLSSLKRTIHTGSLRVISFMRLSFPLIIICCLFIYGCNSYERGRLITNQIRGNWFYIDSICDPDPDFNGKTYVEITFTDSLVITYSTYPGIGPTYYSFELKNDSIKINNARTLYYELENNRLILDSYCNSSTKFELTRLDEHLNNLKEFADEQELDDFLEAVLLRRNSTLAELGLLD